MWTFLVAGCIYLLGVAALLVVRPSYMFTPDGLWKEFGIEKGDEYTLCPVLLFCIVWAFLSYFIAMHLFPDDMEPMDVRPMNGKVDMSAPVELPKGYYVLNNKATRLAGVPKYVYLGEEAP